ncbi:MAG: S9 family peptidase [Gemmatimonadetes bacterium]|nr:S9 family peptidase [Gemmatimonadota bacterium]
MADRSPAAAQATTPYAPDSVSSADYARAEGFLAQATGPLVYGATVNPQWLGDGRFWYRTATAAGTRFIVVDPARRTRAPLFDPDRLAAALSAASGTPYTASTLTVATLEVDPQGRGVALSAGRDWYSCDLGGYTCARAQMPTPPRRNEVASPDGRRSAFIRDYDLWVHDLATGAETPLTTDGDEDHGYATDNAGWTRGDRPVLRWSPDSRRIATFRHDARGVGRMYLVSATVGHPELDSWRYPLPEDTVIFRIERLIFDLDAPRGPRRVRLDMPPDQHRSTVCDHVSCDGTFADVEWSADGRTLAFVSSSRDHKVAVLRVADAETGKVRDVLQETSPTFVESGVDGPNWRYLPESNEVIWFSERDDWGHLYLYDLTTGRLKNAITTGRWSVLGVQRLDAAARTVWLTGNGREPGDPYFRHFYRVRLDGTGLERLTPDSANHDVTFSPDGDWFVDLASTPDTPPVITLRDGAGAKVVDLERADVSALLARGWRPPQPFTVKARDNRTDLYGLLYRPTRFDARRRYPVIDYIYPGPQSGSVGSRSFSASRSDLQALAELGFVVIALDALGTPMRSKSFHEAYYGNMGDNGLPDQIAGIRQLARRFPWMDLNRVGIYGHSGGGYAAADAILRYPEFFKVAVSEAGNHDNQTYEDDWGEKWQGLLEKGPGGTTNYDNQANRLLAENLRGKLLLAYGSDDDNVPPNNTLVLVDALIAANKDFDLLVLPNRNHGFGNEPYMVRRRWDYLVTNLLGARSPREFRFGRQGRPD